MLKQTLALGAMLLSTGLIAEPDRNVNFLMSEPLSLLDHGLYMLRIDLNALSSEKRLGVKFYTLYNWDKNRINLGFIYDAKDINTKEAAKLKCNTVASVVREQYGVDARKGELIPFAQKVGGSSFLKTYFEHAGYENNTAPKDLYKSIDAITEISGGVAVNDGSGDSLECKGPLIGNSMMFSK